MKKHTSYPVDCRSGNPLTPLEVTYKLKDYFDETGLKQSDIARILDVTQAAVSNQLSGRPFGVNAAKKWSKTFGFSKLWLMTGEGPMFVANTKSPLHVLEGDVTEIMGPKHHYDDEIPVIPAWLFRAPNIDIYEHVMNDPNVETLPKVQHFSKHDIFARCPGDAMAPKICKGSIIALTKLDKSEPINNGDIYVVDTYSQGMILRRIIDTKTGIWICDPVNKDQFEPFEISRDDVINVLKIVGVLTAYN